MEIRDYSSLLPTQPPEGLISWLLSQGELRQELLIYKAESYYDPLEDRKKQGVRITCSACDEYGYTEKVNGPSCAAYAPAPFGFVHPETGFPTIAGESNICPYCGEKVKVAHVGSLRYGEEFYSWPTTISRFEDKVLIIGWCVVKGIDKTGLTSFHPNMYEAYIVEEKKIVRLAAYRKFMSQISFSMKWEQRKKYDDVWGSSPLVFPWDPELLIGSTAENSKLDRYMKCKGEHYPVSYLKLWQKHPNTENLIMQGVGGLLAEMIDKEFHRYSYEPIKRGAPKLKDINWKEKRPAQMLGLNKSELAICKEQKWNCSDLDFYRRARNEKMNIRLPDEMLECEELGYYDVLRIHELKLAVMPTVRYLLKQQNKKTGSGQRCDLNYLQDYWNMAQRNGADITIKSIRWPKNLAAAHDRQADVERFRLAAEQKAKDAKKAKAMQGLFDKRTEELSVYAWGRDGLFIRPAASYGEFITEGAALNHCVAGYAERHAKGKTALFWIRRCEKPDEPYFTLEFNEAKQEVKQNRGKNNCDRTKAVTEFELRWLAWVREGCKREEIIKINVEVKTA